MLPFNYRTALYRKDNNGNINVWQAIPQDVCTIHIFHGRLDGTIIEEYIKTHRVPADDIRSRKDAKRKTGYKFLNELKDNIELPNEAGLMQFLEAYLPSTRTTADGSTLAMLAKSYDKANNIFKKVTNYFGQYKINGLRCFIRAEIIHDEGLFAQDTITFKFQSREGTYWDSLDDLANKLKLIIPPAFIDLMAYEGYVLDGELYIPGYSVNDINSAVKNVSNPLNRFIQYWCYDLAIEDTVQYKRFEILDTYFNKYIPNFINIKEHLANTFPFVYLPHYDVSGSSMAIHKRDKFIELGFEGLIMRDPEQEYQFGKRNMSMLKYKKSTDGKFLILDIYPEGEKRDLPLIACKNDINDATFECHLSGTFEYQQKILREKELFIGKFVYLQYSERSGINKVPFHIKTVTIL